MKKFLSVLFKLIIVCFLVFIMFVFGFIIGKKHIITDSKITVDGQYILIEIDGNIYTHIQ